MRHLPHLACVVAASMIISASAIAQEPVPEPAEPPARVGSTPAYPQHSSDGVRGPIAPELSARARAVTPRRTADTSWPAGPGLTYRQFTQTDQRGPVRVSMVSGQLSRRLKLRYLGHDYVRGRGPLTRLVERNHAVAGINGDFFDIAGVGAPLGVGVSGHRLLHGPVKTPNSAFFIDAQGRPRFGTVQPLLPVQGSRQVVATHLNPPKLAPLDLGVYTPAWGNLTGLAVFGGERPVSVREVWIKRGRVVANRARLSKGVPVQGRVLIGRGYRARDLRALVVGSRVDVVRGVRDNPLAALTSNTFLLRNSALTVTDDRQLHPRSAVAYDARTKAVMFVVVDGRSEASRGMTLTEFAELLASLGATDALNLDGGGSSALVARDAAGSIGVRNRPSDGKERAIPNGLGFIARP